MKLKKIVLRDEDIIYPNCFQCGKELSPYILLEMEEEYINLVKETGLIIGDFNNKPVALLCKKCCKIRE